jgi:hypothetical protein
MILCLPDRSPRVTDGRTHPVTADSSRLVMRNRSCVPTSRLPAVRRNTIWFTIARYVCFGCRLAHLSRRRSIQRFTLYGSPHSLPTYKVALLLRMSEEPFAFRYVSFQKKMHQTPEFVALSRWGQVPVLSRASASRSSPQPSSNTSRTLSTAFRVPIQSHDRLCGNGSIGTWMLSSLPSLAAMLQSWIARNYSR